MVATTHVPLGYPRLVGDVELSDAPLALVSVDTIAFRNVRVVRRRTVT